MSHRPLTNSSSLKITAAYCTYQLLKYAEKVIQNEHTKNGKTDARAEHARKELMGMLRVRISS
jgi:hypothetical protein